MAKFRIPYNKHQYSDCSDTPKRGVLTLVAKDREQARYKMYDWRLLNRFGIVNPKTGQRFYIGIIFTEAMEEVKNG